MVLQLADNNNPASLASKARRKRFDFFLSLLSALPKPVRILDIGGTQEFWKNMQYTDEKEVYVDLLNLEHQPVSYRNFTSVKGDATDLRNFPDQSYDVVFSNSVIEHLFTWENQQKMAREVQRVGRNYFIQTPNRYFPVEPHFVFPLFQFLPVPVRVGLLMRFNLGHVKKFTSRDAALTQVKEIQLLSVRQMKQLFPGCAIYYDKFAGLNKSIVAYSFRK